PAPAEADGGGFSAGGRKLVAIIAHGVQARGDLISLQIAHGFDDLIAAGEGIGAAAVFTVAGKKIGSNGDETVGGELVGDRANPIAEAEDLVDDDDDRRFILALGIDDV